MNCAGDDDDVDGDDDDVGPFSFSSARPHYSAAPCLLFSVRILVDDVAFYMFFIYLSTPL